MTTLGTGHIAWTAALVTVTIKPELDSGFLIQNPIFFFLIQNIFYYPLFNMFFIEI